MAREPERRSNGGLRVPFVRRCVLEFEGAPASNAFLVNINTVGAYVTLEEMPRLGQRLTCRFQVPDHEREVSVEGVVAWTNPRQQHPVHSLPPGFGMSFQALSAESRQSIEGLISDYLARQG